MDKSSASFAPLLAQVVLAPCADVWALPRQRLEPIHPPLHSRPLSVLGPRAGLNAPSETHPRLKTYRGKRKTHPCCESPLRCRTSAALFSREPSFGFPGGGLLRRST